MRLRFVAVAQGGGFYGAAFFTTDKTEDEIREALKTHPNFSEIDGADGPHFFLSGESIVEILPFAGEAQPEPVVLFCSGHSQEDLEALKYVKSLL